MLGCLLGACAGHAGEPLVLARPVLLYEGEPERVRLGALRFEAGFVLSSTDPAFGGLSSLWIAPGGGELVTVSDRGIVWRAALEHAGDRLVGLSDWRSARLLPMPTDEDWRLDVEALAHDGGDFVIAVERQEPLRRVAHDDPGAPMRPLAAGQLDDAGAGAGNAGIEALTGLPDGGLLALSEGVLDAPGQLAAWRVSPEGAGRVQRLGYAVSEGFVPTGADRLDQVIYGIERRFALVDGGFVSRVVVFDVAQLDAGMPIRAHELARLAWPALRENFEGIAVRAGTDGRILMYLISDDNFLPIQRTLLLQFSLAP